MRRSAFIVGCVLAALMALAGPDAWADEGTSGGGKRANTASADEPGVIELRRAIVLPRVSGGGRGLVQVDGVLAAWLGGSGEPGGDADDENGVFGAGASVTAPGGGEVTWEAASARGDGVLQLPTAGGYAAFTVAIDEDEAGVWMLEASGHRVVWVNGEPRVGDFYGTGFVRLPLLLHAGEHRLVFRATRRTLRGRLVKSEPGVFVSASDATLPDFPVIDASVPSSAERGTEPGGWMWGSVLVTNAQPFGVTLAVESPSGWGGAAAERAVRVDLGPMSVAKVPVRFAPLGLGEPGAVERPVAVRWSALGEDGGDGAVGSGAGAGVAEMNMTLRAVERGGVRAITRRSAVDGSVQYYAVREAVGEAAEASPDGLGIALSLHGASVEARRQASAYRQRDWVHIVAPTNRRPFGFDWEDWGRLDAVEALEHAQGWLEHDPARVWVTGHSMGGHGTLQLAAHLPGRFAFAGPSAGWMSFWSYSGAPEYAGSPAADVLAGATLASRTERFATNWRGLAMYVLHGDRDETVPVREARSVRDELVRIGHQDFAYYERRGAGHWWGDQCMDWPELFAMMRGRELPRGARGTMGGSAVSFVSAGPGVNGEHHWVRIEQVIDPGEPARVELVRDLGERTVSGTLENVALLSLHMAAFEPGEVDVSVRAAEDGGRTVEATVAAVDGNGWVMLTIDGAAVLPGLDAISTSPRLTKRTGVHGGFKRAFDNEAVLVLPTGGDAEHAAWWSSMARYDNERWWYRGNGRFEVVTDADFLAGGANEGARFGDRNVVLYGDAESNRAWDVVFAGCAVRAEPGVVSVGDRAFAGEGLALLMVRERSDAPGRLAGAIAGTGFAGDRLPAALPYFTSGVGVPDFVVIDAAMLTDGLPGVRAAGWFDNAWSLDGARVGFAE